MGRSVQVVGYVLTSRIPPHICGGFHALLRGFCDGLQGFSLSFLTIVSRH